ncbi:LysR substrate-binding domain-containing protein [Xanthobacter sp. V0B-10]|uniref:LysR substrate-binding domain-containing protein n=1 Tax=Xanthobacter albus TaxID=3119929 RepID=UPI00372B1B7A
MFDLDLLKAFVSVVDAGGFTRAGERVHRTQSTVSQQIRRLEEQAGRELLVRGPRAVSLTAEGERLLAYARRILALSAEARAALADGGAGVVRLGIPEDFALAALTGLVADFAHRHPAVRLSVRCALSCELAADLDRGDLDIALMKRDGAGAGGAAGRATARATWPERLVWVGGPAAPADPAALDPLPLVAFPQGCLYRNRAVHALEQAGRDWRIAYESPNLIGVSAALAGGLGIAVLERRAVAPGHRVLDAAAGLPAIAPTELALCVAPRAPAPVEALADAVAAFCDREAGLRDAA